jgi:thiol-disulfide isomerase/thioredoxin
VSRRGRRATIATALLGLGSILGCGNDHDIEPEPPAVPGRVVAVAAADPANEDAGFCDVQPESRPALALPDVEGRAGAIAGRTWLNVWATWCRPCVEELPMLVRWQPRLAEGGARAALRFLSVDATAEEVSTFRASHPDVPESMRLTDPAALAPFVASLGLDPGATLPIHVFTDAEGRIRCVRTGSIAEEHFDTVARLLR